MIDGNNSLTQLPQGWVWTRLGTVVNRVSNGTTERQEKQGGGIPVTRIETISTGSIDLKRVGYLRGLAPEIIQKYKLIRGDLLFSHINSDPHLGKTAIFNFGNLTLLHGMNLLLIRPNDDALVPEFLHYLCNHYRYSGVFFSIAQHAVNQSSINQTKLRNMAIPLPPLPEQHRIVDKIEELFTRLDAGVEGLKKVKAQLKGYRQAVLKHAFEGKLTEAWREAHKGEIEPVSVLLGRIREERRRNAKGKVRELPPLNTSDLPELPEGWIWTTLGDIRLDKSRTIVPNEAPDEIFELYSVPSFASGKPEIVFGKEIGSNKQTVEKDTVLLCKINPRINRVWIVGDYSAQQQIASTEWLPFFKLQGMEPNYLRYFMGNNSFRDFLALHTSGVGGSLMRINANTFAQYPFPFPPLLEQQKLTDEIERCFSVADAIEKDVEQSLKQAERLRQSILKRAFEGKLVPQDPTDEPAEELLEHIRAERARIEAEKKATGKTRRS